MELVLKNIESQSPFRINPHRPICQDEFYDLCVANPDVRMELTAKGEIIVVPPTGGETSNRNNELARQLGNWARRDGRGRAFDSNAEYLLPDGSALSPDASWIDRERLASLTREQKRKFPPVVPDFIVELVSPSDRLSAVRKKMEAWMANGVKLGWLLDPDRHTAHIYRPRREPEKLIEPPVLKGEGPVAGFVLDLADIWNPDI
ncbi:MAG TPA: Uma2 family endonuclease [Bryobacteraceae bacterium]|nr:Uma2 family endonuclease [Bryobacteraceae bacterium]